MYRVLADAVVVAHFGFLVFVVVGGFLALRWPWVLWLHLPAVAWAIVIVVHGALCPLTYLENELRARAGEASLQGGFIDTYVEGVVYPARFVGLARALVALAVLCSWSLLLRRQRARLSSS